MIALLCVKIRAEPDAESEAEADPDPEAEADPNRRSRYYDRYPQKNRVPAVAFASKLHIENLASRGSN